MADFFIFLQLGWEHIMSPDALDHQLFIIALIAAYSIQDFKKILILVTAFTIGHSITLALISFKLVSINSSWVEFLIPLTILITAAENIILHRSDKTLLIIKYVLALLFGLVHGMGFANTAKMMLAKEQSVGVPLLGFNIGLEVGQLVVVMMFLFISWLAKKFFKVPQKYWIFTISAIIAVLSLKMVIERMPF